MFYVYHQDPITKGGEGEDPHMLAACFLAGPLTPSKAFSEAFCNTVQRRAMTPTPTNTITVFMMNLLLTFNIFCFHRCMEICREAGYGGDAHLRQGNGRWREAPRNTTDDE